MNGARAFSPWVRLYVWSVAVACVASLALSRGPFLPEDLNAYVIVGLMALLVGLYTVRLDSSSVELSSSYPFLLYSLAEFGRLPAVWLVLLCVAATLLPQFRRQRPLRLFFNLAAIALSVSIAGRVFEAVPLDRTSSLVVAAAAYLLVNVVVVSLAVTLDRRDVGLFGMMRQSLQWTGPAALTGTALGIAMVLASSWLGLLGIATVLVPCWVVLSFYRLNEARIASERRRNEEVEQLNSELSSTVEELREAMRHIKQLRGLIPICMHCKSIRDESDVWHRLEAYLGEHSDAHLTHSLCESCREKHYPDVKRIPTPQD